MTSGGASRIIPPTPGSAGSGYFSLADKNAAADFFSGLNFHRTGMMADFRHQQQIEAAAAHAVAGIVVVREEQRGVIIN